MSDENAFLSGVTEEPSPEATEQPNPPEVDEAIRQMQATQQDILSRLPADEEYGEEDGGEYEYETDADADQFEDGELEYRDDDGEIDEGDEDPLDPLRELIRSEIEPVYGEIDSRENERNIESLIQHFPEMDEPEVAEGIRSYLEQTNLFPEDGSFPDAYHVELAYKAYKADVAASGETPAEAGGEQGASLETGAGPSAPEEEIDPQTKGYLDAIAGSRSRNAFVR